MPGRRCEPVLEAGLDLDALPADKQWDDLCDQPRPRLGVEPRAQMIRGIEMQDDGIGARRIGWPDDVDPAMALKALRLGDDFLQPSFIFGDPRWLWPLLDHRGHRVL